MPLAMNRDVFITCAVTGSGDTTSKSANVPITPKQIADVSTYVTQDITQNNK